MEVYALVGASGTGKSHRAARVAKELDVQAIIDDGLLIRDNQIIAGSSAKLEPTIIDAIKAAIFMDENRAREMMAALENLAPKRILILGTSVRMIGRITDRLNLPQAVKVVHIEDCASEKEIRKAKYLRTHFYKHVIPAPTLEVKKTFPGTLVDSLDIFLKRKEATGKKEWVEQSIIRPTFTLHGKLVITDHAITNIVDYASQPVPGLAGIGRIVVKAEQEGTITIDITPTLKYGLPIQKVAKELQQKIITAVEQMTGLQVRRVSVLVKSLNVPQKR